MHAYISRNTYWRSGVVLVSEDGANRALVKSDIEDKQIDIQVDGPTDQRRSFLSLLRADFLKIHATLPSLDVEEKIPLTDTPDVEIDYQHLLKLEERGIQTFWPEGYDRELNVSALLNGIEMRYGPPIHSSLVPPSSIPLSTPSEAGTGTEVIPRHILQEYEKSKVSPSEKLLAAISGIAFLLILLAIALFVPNPTNFQLFTFRVVLAISAGAFASLLSGFICVHGSFQRLLIRAGGGFAVFVIIFALNPPKLISSSVNDGSPKEGHIKTIRSDDHGIYTRISE
jgi:hypothetical protein